MWTSASYYVYFGLLLFTVGSRLICAQGNFSMNGTSYSCTGVEGPQNMLCLGDAHVHLYSSASDSIRSGDPFNGSLSLVLEEGSSGSAGIAYYYKPIRMRDPSTNQSASFNTSFTFHESQKKMEFNQTSDELTVAPGDGFVFVISADNKSVNANHTTSGRFGFFGPDGGNSFKSIVVEFDTWGDNVSLDFTNNTHVAIKTLPGIDIGVTTMYVWVEYSAETQQLQVRAANTSYSRPINPLYSYTVDLFDKVEEYMWVGFSGANGLWETYADSQTGESAPFASYYYIGKWSFESYGIASAPVTSRKSTIARTKVEIIVGISVGALALLCVVGIFVLFFARRRDSRTGIRTWRWGPGRPSHIYSEESAMQLSDVPHGYRFSYNQLSLATGGFSEESKLGQGGFGSVYRGALGRSGAPIAVKKINCEADLGEKEFVAEVSIISQLRHRNLIQLLGWCDERGEYLIVYELMPNGSLDKVLFEPNEKLKALTWPQRLNIVTNTAAAINYLHEGWTQRVIHRDIKSSNIMLDGEWNAKLGDFGLARLVDHQRTPMTTLVAGTFGYIAPEAASGKFTDKTDVFAFGAVVLEIACGRKAFAARLSPDEMILVDWVWQNLDEGNLLSVVDGRLGDYDAHWMEVLLRMGLLCSHPNPLDRPTMRQVVQILAGEATLPPIPTSKPVAVFIAKTDAKDFAPSQKGIHVISESSSQSSFSLDSGKSSESLLLSKSVGEKENTVTQP